MEDISQKREKIRIVFLKKIKASTTSLFNLEAPPARKRGPKKEAEGKMIAPIIFPHTAISPTPASAKWWRYIHSSLFLSKRCDARYFSYVCTRCHYVYSASGYTQYTVHRRKKQQAKAMMMPIYRGGTGIVPRSNPSPVQNRAGRCHVAKNNLKCTRCHIVKK